MTAQSVAVNVTGTGVVSAAPCTYRGLSIRDTSGATNTVTVYDNASAATGTVVATFQLAANADRQDDINDGVRAAAGLYLSSTGSLVGSVRVG